MRERALSAVADTAPRSASEWGRMDVSSVRLTAPSHTDLTASQQFIAPDDDNRNDRTVLMTPLPQPVEPGGTATIEIAWTAHVPRTFARTGAIGNFFFIAQWFPKLGVLQDEGWNCHQFHAGTEFFSDYGSYDVSLTVPAGWPVGATGVQRERRDNGDGSITLTLSGGKTVDVDTVLVATGRRPWSEGLGLEAVGISRADRGKIAVNDKLQTSVPSIYAIGDVTDIKQLAHFASAQGKAAAEVIAGHPSQTNWRAVPAATFTSPEIASVGLTESEAKAEGRKVKVGRFPFRAHGRNIADGETTGFVKIVGDADSGQVLGTSIFGAKASELIHEAALAIGADLDVSAIAQAIHAHPTMMEALGEAAEDADNLAVHLLRTEAKVGAK